jgi:hypothetical protein
MWPQRVQRSVQADIFNLPRDCQTLVRGSKLARKPASRVAAHGVVDDQRSLGAITLRALESAEFVTRRARRNVGQDRTGLAVLTARPLYDTQRRAGW